MDEERKETFGDRLRRFRQEAGLSQRKLAKITGIAREYICQLEADRVKNPTVRIASVTGVSNRTISPKLP